MKNNSKMTTVRIRAMYPNSLKALLLSGSIIATVPAFAQEAEQAVQCSDAGCSADGHTLVRIRTEGERQPRVQGETSEELQDNRRVDVALPPVAGRDSTPKITRAAGRFSIELPGGGRIWAVEDPAVVTPVLSVGSGATAPVEGGRITEPVKFNVYSNYARMFERMEISIYKASDVDLVAPLAVLTPEKGNTVSVDWDGQIQTGDRLRQGDELLYVLRVYDDKGRFDETRPGRLTLLSTHDHQSGLSQIRGTLSRDGSGLLHGRSAEDRLVQEAIFGNDQLRRRNIVLQGSRVRIMGQDIPEGMMLSIDGQPYPIDIDRRFVAEMLLPTGKHTVDLELGAGPDNSIRYPLEVEVSGKYFYAVAIADATLSNSNVTGSVSAAELGESAANEDLLVDGRIAFYAKAKTDDQVIITAHADTGERKAENLFDNFFKADPRDIFRRLDPDQYYPVYGDDSTTYRDVDTQGRLYLRADWKQNQALWGNYATGLTGTELSQYTRSLYGGALAFRSDNITKWGDPKTTFRAFGSEAQTASGHVELLGTGGSVYYLKHTDLLPGSERIVVELRDLTTGRTEASIPLTSGVDYEIDNLQGRIILARPLMQMVRQNMPTIMRDQPLSGFEQRVIADYEYVPRGFDADHLTAGVRGKQWFGDHVAVGGTYVDENRDGDDYKLIGGDITLRAGKGSYIKAEYAHTENTQAPTFWSDNGGLSFTQLNASTREREGDAFSVEARANLRELGVTGRDAVVSGWWRDLDAGYSTAYRDPNGEHVREIGMDFAADLTDTLSMNGVASELKRGTNKLRQFRLLADWDITEADRLTAEVRSVRESIGALDADGLLAALKYNRRVTDSLDVYGIVQQTLSDDNGAYADNDAYTLGVNWVAGSQTTVSAEHSWGDRGDSTTVDANYQVTNDYSIYGRYALSTDTTDRLFESASNAPGLTIGHRWRPTNQISLYNENQWLKENDQSGLAHTYGLDFVLGKGWNVGLTYQDAELHAISGLVDRQAFSLSGGYRNPDMEWSSRVEYRKDQGAEERTQWASTNRLMWRVDKDLRLAARLNFADTDDRLDPAASAKFIEGGIGFALRPHDTTRWAILGKYTYLYDLRSLGQEETNFDQKSHILSTEGIYKADANWEVALKTAYRMGSARIRRGDGPWFDSEAVLAAGQIRYHLPFEWDALLEYRWLHTDIDDGVRQGFLVGIDRRISDHFRIGVGYNFTDFSGDLSDHDYEHKGWFLNFTGSY